MAESPQVIVYSRYNCRFCDLTKSLLQAESVPYQERNIEEDPAALQQISDWGFMGVPVTEYAGETILGFDKPKLDELVAKVKAA